MEREFGTVISAKEKEEAILKTKELIESSPEEAVQYLRENPIAVLVLPKLKRKTDGISEEKLKHFYKLLEEEKENIFLPLDSLEKNGLTLTLELLIDNWRETFGDNDVLAMKNLFERTLDMIEEKIDRTDDSSGNKITVEMLNDFRMRIRSLENYERKQFRAHIAKHEDKIKEYIRDQVNMTIGLEDIPSELEFLLQIATMSVYSLIEFKAYLSKILAKELRSAFGFEEEEMKYNLAPWIGILEHTALALENNLETKIDEVVIDQLKKENKQRENQEDYM